MNLETIVRRLLPGAEAMTEEEVQDAITFLDGEIAKLDGTAAEPVAVAPVEASPVVPVVPAPVTEDVPAPAPQAHTGEIDYSAPAVAEPDPIVVPDPVVPAAPPVPSEPVDHTVSTTPEPDTALPPTPPPPDTSTEPA